MEGGLRRNTTWVLNQAEGGADWDEPPPSLKDSITSPRDVLATAEFELPSTPHGTTSPSGEAAFAAAEAGQVKELQQVLKKDPSAALFISPIRGRTPLLAASRGGHMDCVTALLKAHAAPDQTNSSGVSPLHIAAAGGHSGCVKLLLKAGASRRMRDASGRTALQWARESGNAAVAEMIDPSAASSDSLMSLAIAPLKLAITWIVIASLTHGWSSRAALLCHAHRLLHLAPPPLPLALGSGLCAICALGLSTVVGTSFLLLGPPLRELLHPLSLLRPLASWTAALPQRLLSAPVGHLLTLASAAATLIVLTTATAALADCVPAARAAETAPLQSLFSPLPSSGESSGTEWLAIDAKLELGLPVCREVTSAEVEARLDALAKLWHPSQSAKSLTRTLLDVALLQLTPLQGYHLYLSPDYAGERLAAAVHARDVLFVETPLTGPVQQPDAVP